MPDRQQREEQHATRSQPLQGRDDQDLHVSSKGSHFLTRDPKICLRRSHFLMMVVNVVDKELRLCVNSSVFRGIMVLH